MNRKGASSIEEIIVVIILVIFAVVFFIIIHSGFLSSLIPSNFLLFSSPNSAPAMCSLNASRIQNSACDYTVEAYGGSSGLIYSMYEGGYKLCTYVAGSTTCTEKITAPAMVICNTTGEASGGSKSSFGAGGGNSLNLSCS